jgi:hypothetical protein
VHTDAGGCARYVCEKFVERQRKVLDDAFGHFLEWTVSCLNNSCESVQRAQNWQPRGAAATCLSSREGARKPRAGHSARSAALL